MERSYRCAVQRSNRRVAKGESCTLLQEETGWMLLREEAASEKEQGGLLQKDVASSGRKETGPIATRKSCKLLCRRRNRAGCYKKVQVAAGRKHALLQDEAGSCCMKKQRGLLQEGASCRGKKQGRLLQDEAEVATGRNSMGFYTKKLQAGQRRSRVGCYRTKLHV